MFDGLKETLGRFQQDVEEEIEPEDDGLTDADEAPAAEAAGGNEADDEAAGEPTAETAAVGDAAPADETADDTAEGEETDTSATDPAGFARRAKSLARGKTVIDEDDLEGPLQDLELALLSNDVEMGVAEEILGRVRENLVGETKGLTTRTGSVVEDALREALLSVVDVGEADFDERVHAAERPVVVIFTGVNGVGKTTSIAKVARHLEAQGRSVVLANGDTYRAGANEQLREHAEALGLKLITHEQGGDPAAVLYDAVEYARANDVDVVLGDTAGRLHTDQDLMAQLEKIGRVVDPDLTVFVDEAVAGQDAVKRARQFNEAAAIDGTILAKADADTAGGAAISIAHVTGKPILFLGTGQSYDDLEPFDPEALVDRLLGEE